MCRRLPSINVWEKGLRIIFGQKRNEIIGGWRKLHNGALHSMFSSPNIIRMIMSMRIRQVRHVAEIGEIEF
jgi:hypothetical protein